MHSQPLTEKFYPSLEGLRGIAVLAVIAYHNFPFANVFFGWLGVDLFFVLSGFLITSIILRSVGPTVKKGFLKHFYIRRILRIFPLYYLVIFIFLFLLPAMGLFDELTKDYTVNRWWYIFYLQNWLYVTDFPSSSHFLEHLWSLAVEEQYYLIWPIMILIFRKPKRLIFFLLFLLCLLFAFRCLTWNAHLTNFNYTNFFTFTRLDGLIIGSLVAIVSTMKKDFLLLHTSSIFFTLAFLNFLFYFLNTSGNLPYYAFIGFTTFAAMFGLLVFELVQNEKSLLSSVFSAHVLRFFGRISYALYIFHWPIHYLLRSPIQNGILNSFHTEILTSVIITSLVTTLIAVLLSLLSFHTLERKFLSLKKKYT